MLNTKQTTESCSALHGAAQAFVRAVTSSMIDAAAA